MCKMLQIAPSTYYERREIRVTRGGSARRRMAAAVHLQDRIECNIHKTRNLVRNCTADQLTLGPEPKTVDLPASSADFIVKRQATWGMLDSSRDRGERQEGELNDNRG